MPTPTPVGQLRARLLAIATTLILALATCAAARTLVVYPFDSPDLLLGAAVADRVALALADDFEVIGPEVAPALLPPITALGGFLNPSAFLQDGLHDHTGAALFRGALGADVVVTGEIRDQDDELVADLYLADRAGVDRLSVTAPGGDPGRLAELMASRLASRLGLTRPPAQEPLDLSGRDGVTARVVALLGGGFLQEAAALLEQEAGDDPRLQGFAATVEAVLEDRLEGDPALAATLALSREPLDEPRTVRYFERFAASSELPAATMWLAALHASVNDHEAATAAYERAAALYPYGLAGQGAYLAQRGDPTGLDTLRAMLDSGDLAALLVVGAATPETDPALEKEAWQRLTGVAPFFAYPFERLSFIAFDEGDALAAGEALAVAVELEPDSDLYWTNLGWAYYLLGLLEQSERASLRAVELSPGQYIASYNLGLVRVVTGRLEEGMSAYADALRLDPEVDAAAVEDLEEALTRFPGRPEVHYALATLLESAGRRADAARHYLAFTESAAEGPFAQRAAQRAEALMAPPPPIEIEGGVRLSLGPVGDVPPYHPGDPLQPSFEVYTPGEELPRLLNVTYGLTGPAGQVVDVEHTVEVPPAAIGLVVDKLPFALPPDLAAGTYRLRVEVSASEERHAEAEAVFEVAGEPDQLRQLLGRNIVLQSLEFGQPLYSATDLTRTGVLDARLLAELELAAEAAEETLPIATMGRFEGMSGGEVFLQSGSAEVRDFLGYVLGSGLTDASFVFVEAYAQWALEGAPTE